MLWNSARQHLRNPTEQRLERWLNHVQGDMMDTEQTMLAVQAERSTPPSDGLERRIAQHNATIQTIERRFVLASAPHRRFSCTALRNQLAIEQELAAGHAERGALRYDRQFATAANA